MGKELIELSSKELLIARNGYEDYKESFEFNTSWCYMFDVLIKHAIEKELNLCKKKKNT